MKHFRRLTLACFLAAIQILFIITPVFAVTSKISTVAKKVTLADYGVSVEVPDNATSVLTMFNMELTEADVTTLPQSGDLYIGKAVNARMTQGAIEVRSLLKPLRFCFGFDELDLKRASNLDTDLPVGRFRVGLWDKNKQQWKQLPSVVYWNGAQGVVEAESIFGSGIYALLWSNNPDGALTPFGEDTIRLMVNYNIITPPSAPYMKNGRTMVPLAVIASYFRYSVTWNSDERRIDLYKTDNRVSLWIGKNLIKKGDFIYNIPASPEIINKFTYVPLSAIAEALGVAIEWDPVTSTAKVSPK